MRTWRLVGVVCWEAHLSFEVSAIVQRVWVDDDQGDSPVVEVFLIAELSYKSVNLSKTLPKGMNDLDLHPFLLGQSLVFVHQYVLGHFGDQCGRCTGLGKGCVRAKSREVEVQDVKGVFKH